MRIFFINKDVQIRINRNFIGFQLKVFIITSWNSHPSFHFLNFMIKIIKNPELILTWHLSFVKVLFIFKEADYLIVLVKVGMNQVD